MELGKYKTREVQPTVLRLHPDLRDELIRVAAENNRSLTKEIAIRLQVSLGGYGPGLQGILARNAFGVSAEEPTAPGLAPSTTGPQGQAVHLTAHDMAMLRVFHSMPVEKQLALLSLFN
jgi:hypothetical protein